MRKALSIPLLAVAALALAAPSASWGIHFGLTKLVISMARRPVSESASMKRTLSSVAIMRDSFCNPSRGPTS